MIASWGDYFHWVSWGSDKNCGFFTNGQFLSVYVFFLLRPYVSTGKIIIMAGNKETNYPETLVGMAIILTVKHS